MNEKPLNQKHVSKPLTGSVHLQSELQLNTKLTASLTLNPSCFFQMEQPSMDQKGHANVPWIVEPGQEAKRGVNTKYETTIF